jgi:hypothetical protein
MSLRSVLAGHDLRLNHVSRLPEQRFVSLVHSSWLLLKEKGNPKTSNWQTREFRFGESVFPSTLRKQNAGITDR